jgi:polyferredoxin
MLHNGEFFHLQCSLCVDGCSQIEDIYNARGGNHVFSNFLALTMRKNADHLRTDNATSIMYQRQL